MDKIILDTMNEEEKEFYCPPVEGCARRTWVVGGVLIKLFDTCVWEKDGEERIAVRNRALELYQKRVNHG